MKIWIDGDACPRAIKAVLFRAAMRTQTCLMLISNHALSAPISPFIKKHQVGAGFDAVDHYITANIEAGDLVITADIPFADAVITAKGLALNPRGELYSINNIKQHLSIRHMNESLRSYQAISGGPDKLTAKDIQCFANHLDRLLAKQHNNRG